MRLVCINAVLSLLMSRLLARVIFMWIRAGFCTFRVLLEAVSSAINLYLVLFEFSLE
jgi:hypothetical protein